MRDPGNEVEATFLSKPFMISKDRVAHTEHISAWMTQWIGCSALHCEGQGLDSYLGLWKSFQLFLHPLQNNHHYIITNNLFQNLIAPGCRKKNFPTVHRSGCSVENFHGKNLTTLHYSKQNWCTYIKINFYQVALILGWSFNWKFNSTHKWHNLCIEINWLPRSLGCS